MATLHLPKNRQRRERPADKLERQLDEGLRETFPASDPVAATAPGGPVGAESTPKRKSDQRA